MQSIKGVTRAYRKSCRRVGMEFPLRGAFHIRRNSVLVQPPDVQMGDAVIGGPIHLRDAFIPAPKPVVFAPVSVSLPAVFRRVERIGKDGETTKKRTDYRQVRNPKGGERYYIKREKDGKMKWLEVEYSKLVAEVEEAAAA